MANKLSDLSDILFQHLRHVADTQVLTATDVDRAQVMVGISSQILKVADSQLASAKLYAEAGDKILKIIPVIGEPLKIK